MSSKKQLRRQVRELTWMVDRYADLLDYHQGEEEFLDAAIEANHDNDEFIYKLRGEIAEYKQKLFMCEEREKWNRAAASAQVKVNAQLKQQYDELKAQVEKEYDKAVDATVGYGDFIVDDAYKHMEARYNAALSAQTRLEQERGQLAEALGRAKHAAEYWKKLWEYDMTPAGESATETLAELARLKDLAGLG